VVQRKNRIELKKYLKIGLFVSLFWWAQFALGQDTIPLNTFYSFEATYSPGYTYSWWYVDDVDNKTYFTSSTNKTEDYYWDTQGEYQLFVQASDTNNCLSEIISKGFSVVDEANNPGNNPGNIAGADTTIGACVPYVLGGIMTDEENYTFLWEPGENLDDPTRATPLFTPGSTTIFRLTATDSLGVSEVDSVKITVREIIAEAGEDVYVDPENSIILDGSGSIGVGLQYYWTTFSGEIESGRNTANPVVSGLGTYYLEVTDTFNCVSMDSVRVELLSYSPIANDDFDTTSQRTEVKISVLNNDFDPENNIDSLSLKIIESPFNGKAYVDYNDFTIVYTPNENFTGTDIFSYQICDFTDKCDEADVFVMVTRYEFIIPNAFSPNRDNINDYWEIVGIEQFEGNSISIFNRWGNKIYTATNYGISTIPQFWDGKSNTGFLLENEDLPTGTYFYVLNLGNGKKSIAGSVYIDR
jgi:gliding motility-associated-like protein